MKKLITYYFIGCAFLYSSAQEECSKLKSIQKIEKSNTLSIAQIAEAERYDVHYYSLNVSLTNLNPFISGTVEIHASARENLDSALFELYQTMVISDIRVNGTSVFYSRNISAVKVPVLKLANESFIIAIDYNGTPPNSGTNPMGGSGLTSPIDITYNAQVTASLSEPFSAYEWWPCKQSLKDKADSCEVKITVPNNCKAGSNGLLKQVVDLGDGTSRYEWKQIYPIDYYLISVAVAEYIDYSIYANPIGAPNPVLIQNYIFNNPQVLSDWNYQLDQTADYIELFSTLFGLYPFYKEKYGHCMAPIGGGMEHQTMTTQVNFGKNLTAHELGHQWFGDNVTCASWADIWVNEGFATYCQYLMLENMYPLERASQMDAYHLAAMQYLDGSVYIHSDTLSANRIFNYRLTYAKGAAIINTMRFVINNDEAFFQGLKDYQTNFKGGTASGLDVKATLENASGVDLTKTFEEWYYGEGYPTYNLRWNRIGYNLSLEISQYPSGEFLTQIFTNPLEISFERENKSDTTIRFEINQLVNQYLIKDIGRVTNIASIDPYNWIINNSGTLTYDPEFEVIVNDNSQIPALQVSPNPTEGPFLIVANSPGVHYLKIIDSKGKLVSEKVFTKDLEFDITTLAQGMYVLLVTSEFGVKDSIKVIKR